MTTKIGSLFDGSGGFPLAAALCGFEPAWASEVEPYPIAVTRSHFPYMIHLGDVSKVNGADIEPVDVITFGSPCQDMSIAGKRAGIKHTGNGDEKTTRSGLFMEAVRIIKEMREATHGRYPTFAVWENVPGAFSSNNGEDFRLVLEELAKIVEPTCTMPQMPKGGWPYADRYMGDGWSVAYRTLDAQFWGVPQRRRRIYLVADFGGQRAGKILFEREGLRGHIAEGRAPWERAAADAEGGVAAGCIWTAITNSAPSVLIAFAQNQRDEIRDLNDVAGTLAAEPGMKQQTFVVLACDARGNLISGDGMIASTITGDHENQITDYTTVVCMAHCQANAEILENCAPCLNCNHEQPIVFGKEVYNSGINATGGHYIAEGGPAPTLRACGSPPGVCTRYIVRRLTPTECARLQGFPDEWGKIEPMNPRLFDDVAFWRQVYLTHCEISGKSPRQSILRKPEKLAQWHDNLHTDSAEYKMWGNGIALPNALYVMQGIADAVVKEEQHG